MDKLLRRSRVERTRVRLGDGVSTTLHLASYEREAFDVRVVVLERPVQLVRWCRERGVRDAVVGGFFLRLQYVPLREVRIDGVVQPSVAFDPPWGEVRACVQIVDGRLRIARRDEFGAVPAGDLLQSAPLLVAAGRCAIVAGEDLEGSQPRRTSLIPVSRAGVILLPRRRSPASG
jgi:hypothetical protein